MKLNRSSFDEAVLGRLVQLRRKTQSPISNESSVEIVHAHERRDALEDHLSHGEKVDTRQRLLRLRDARPGRMALPQAEDSAGLDSHLRLAERVRVDDHGVGAAHHGLDPAHADGLARVVPD